MTLLIKSRPIKPPLRGARSGSRFMRFAALAILAIHSPQNTAAAPIKVTSPDGRLVVSLEGDSGTFGYTLDAQGTPLISHSALGLDFGPAGKAPASRWQIAEPKTRSVHSSWKPLWGKRAVVPDRCRETTIELIGPGAPFDRIANIVRAYYDGIARQQQPWRESKTLSGVIGAHTVMARQSAQGVWLVGAATNEEARELELKLDHLRNPVWTSGDNLRDPSVLKTSDGYRIFYSRYTGGAWNQKENWAVASVITRDFVAFEDTHDVSPKGFASPGDVISWHGRWLLPYQSYPQSPSKLCFSESKDLSNWSAPRFFLDEAAALPWNTGRRVIDPTFVVDGETLHCFFIGTGYREKNGKKIRGNLMGHAITRDPKLEKWEILTPDAPLIGFSESAPDGVENTMIIRTGDHWTMIYSEGLADQHLASATSPDLIEWKLEGPIEIPRQKWMSRRFGAPFIWRDGSQWLMILMGTNDKDRTTFGLLTSNDARHWKLLAE